LCSMGPTPLAKRGEPPIFGTCLLRPNGCMDRGVTWYSGRPRPSRHCVRWGPSFPPQKGGGAPYPFSVHVYCGQTAGWITMAVGMEVDGGPGHIVLDGDPALLPKRVTAPNFRPIFIVAKRLDASRYHLVHGGRPQPRRLCVRSGPSHPQNKGHTHPTPTSTQFVAHV